MSEWTTLRDRLASTRTKSEGENVTKIDELESRRPTPVLRKRLAQESPPSASPTQRRKLDIPGPSSAKARPTHQEPPIIPSSGPRRPVESQDRGRLQQPPRSQAAEKAKHGVIRRDDRATTSSVAPKRPPQTVPQTNPQRTFKMPPNPTRAPQRSPLVTRRSLEKGLRRVSVHIPGTASTQPSTSLPAVQSVPNLKQAAANSTIHRAIRPNHMKTKSASGDSSSSLDLPDGVLPDLPRKPRQSPELIEVLSSDDAEPHPPAPKVSPYEVIDLTLDDIVPPSPRSDRRPISTAKPSETTQLLPKAERRTVIKASSSKPLSKGKEPMVYVELSDSEEHPPRVVRPQSSGSSPTKPSSKQQKPAVGRPSKASNVATSPKVPLVPSKPPSTGLGRATVSAIADSQVKQRRTSNVNLAKMPPLRTKPVSDGSDISAPHSPRFSSPALRSQSSNSPIGSVGIERLSIDPSPRTTRITQGEADNMDTSTESGNTGWPKVNWTNPQAGTYAHPITLDSDDDMDLQAGAGAPNTSGSHQDLIRQLVQESTAVDLANTVPGQSVQLVAEDQPVQGPALTTQFSEAPATPSLPPTVDLFLPPEVALGNADSTVLSSRIYTDDDNHTHSGASYATSSMDLDLHSQQAERKRVVGKLLPKIPNRTLDRLRMSQSGQPSIAGFISTEPSSAFTNMATDIVQAQAALPEVDAERIQHNVATMDSPPSTKSAISPVRGANEDIISRVLNQSGDASRSSTSPPSPGELERRQRNKELRRKLKSMNTKQRGKNSVSTVLPAAHAVSPSTLPLPSVAPPALTSTSATSGALSMILESDSEKKPQDEMEVQAILMELDPPMVTPRTPTRHKPDLFPERARIPLSPILLEHKKPKPFHPRTFQQDLGVITEGMAHLLNRPKEHRKAKDLDPGVLDLMRSMHSSTQSSKIAKDMFEAMIRKNTSTDEAKAPPIQVFNIVDNNGSTPPWEFIYSNEMWYGEDVPPPDNDDITGCDCEGPCDPSSSTCSCVKEQERWTNSPDQMTHCPGFAYDSKECMRQEFHQWPVFECNWKCRCSEDCPNRVVQKGRRITVNLVKTQRKGWGVFAGPEPIPAGAFVGVYAGELIKSDVAEQRGLQYYNRIKRTYIFDIDHWWLKYLPTPASRAHYTVPVTDEDDEDGWDTLYAVDAFHVGNFTRFLNHSCDPNVFINAIYVNDADLHKPLFCMFTSRAIKPFEELCFNYMGDDDDTKNDGAGNAFGKCECGAKNCRGIMFV